MAADPEIEPVPPFSRDGIKSKVTKLHKASSHVAEVFKLAEEIEDECYETYYEDGFDSDSPRSP
eukprot:8783275-Prorocentrum_lima.AAC.1